MPKVQDYVVVVEGLGSFPIDMLRYDRLVPRTEADSGLIEARGTAPRRVELLAIARDRFWGPTGPRWGSFLWRVIEVRVLP